MKLAYFAFYETFETCLNELDEETQNKFLHYIIRYGLHGERPENLTGFELAFWKTIEFAIDGQKVRASVNSENRKKGNERKNISFLAEKEIEENNFSFLDKNEKKESKGKNISLHEEEEEKEYEKEEEEEMKDNPTLAPLSQYSLKIFDIFKNAGLPCANNNELSFLQRDFKNGLNYLHSQSEFKHLHSNDVIGACENYAKVVNHPDTYVKNKNSFDRFVRYKNFIDFLPDNFHLENFIRYDRKDAAVTAPPEEKIDRFAELNPPDLCKVCGTPLIQNKNDLICHCENCGAWTEYNSESKTWDWETETHPLDEVLRCAKTT